MALTTNTREHKQGIWLIELVGKLDSETSPDCMEKIRPLFTEATNGVVFDLRGLEFISSAGLQIIFTTRKTLEKYKAATLITNLQPQIKKVFEVVEALPDFQIFESVEEADRYLATIQEKELERIKEEEQGK